MYVVQLGKTGMDGFRAIESSNFLAKNLDAARVRAVDLLKTRGTQLGCNKAMLLGENKQVVYEYP
jgi:hypothetical protein